MTKQVMFSIAIIFACSFSFAATQNEIPLATQANMLVKTIEKYHYKPKVVNDSFSLSVYNNFFNFLDPYGIIFTQEAINKLDIYKFSIDDQIKQQKSTFLDSVTAVYITQLKMTNAIMKDFYNKEIDIAKSDTFWIYNHTKFSKQVNLGTRWEQWLKYKILWTMQNNADSSGKIGKPTIQEIAKLMNEVLKGETCRFSSKLNSVDKIKEQTNNIYLKAIAQTFDPHTQYLSLNDKKQWDINLSKESKSFGVRLQFTILGEIEITEVSPGSPAWRSNKINKGDVILNIKKQDGTTVDLQCATGADVENFILSIGNSKTEFKIRKENGKIISVSLTKDIMSNDDNIIHSFVLNDNKAIGYIYLPSFYADFTYANYFSKGCANDIAKALMKLKKDGVEGLILDLRSNGGGSLQEALRIAGEFIDFGALSITQYRDEKPEIQKDNARGTIFNKPLVVLVNASTASASELLAGVLQDYNRAIIVGSKTFGKSTIQNVIPCDAGNFDSLSHYKGEPKGFLTLTTGTFFRVNGKNHQSNGIMPDISLPDVFENKQFRESSYDNPLTFAPINKNSFFTPCTPLPIATLKTLYESRLATNNIVAIINRLRARIPDYNSPYAIPLNLNSFSQFSKDFRDIDDSIIVTNCPFSIALADSGKNSKSMTSFAKADCDTIMHHLQTDFSINQAFTITNDLIANTKKEDGK